MLAAPLRAVLVRAVRGVPPAFASPIVLSAPHSRSMHWTAVREAQPAPPAPERLKPASPAYFTTKPSYIDTLQMLDQLTREVKRELEQTYVLPFNSRPPPLPQGPTNIWISREQLHSKLGITLRASQYRSVISRLTLLLRYRALVYEHFCGTQRTTTHQRELVQQVEEVLASFMSMHGKAQERQSDAPSTGTSARGLIDDVGRAYARGRRKESSARIWLVKAKDAATELCQIRVNNVPLNQYFLRTTHREQVVWPFKLAGLLGAYNVFGIVRGGGASGQAGALAHGIANALVASLGAEGAEAHERVKLVLSKDGVLNRDPRMVERKKPGLAKARKAYTWVKR